MKEINILGLKLRDYPFREKMRLADDFLKDGVLNTIEFVSAQMIMKAGDNEQQKEWLEAMDMAVYCDEDIVRAAGIAVRSRLKEIENNSFLKEFLKKLARERRTVYLLSDAEETMAALYAGLESMEISLYIAGKSILKEDEAGDGEDAVINDMNDKAPAVIISMLTYPQQEAFIFRNKNRINADVWMGLQQDSFRTLEKEKALRSLTRKLQRKIFRRKVHRYENQERTEL